MKRLMWLGAAGLAALLAGCGNDDAPASADFVGTVSAVVATPEATAEVSVPLSVDTVVAMSSETAEPVAVTF